MKKLHYILAIAVVTLVTSCSTSRNYAQSGYYDNNNYYQGEVSYQQFYDELSPYGSWISYPGHGYVWAPYETGFTPYSTNGHWVYTTYGWTWVSNYRWGWAPFHYGRWFMDARFGWLWVPGYEWGPAWVAWRGGGGYYGWAPLGPGMSINISIGMIPNNYWCFVPNRYINHRNVYKYRVKNTTIINNTTVINNNYYNNNRTVNYNAGPPVREVERATQQRIAPVRVVNSSTPGNTEIRRNEVALYRPDVNQNAGNSRPTRVVTEPVKRDAPVRRNLSNDNGSIFQSNGVDQSRPVQRSTPDNPVKSDVNTRPVRTPGNTNPSQNERIPVQRSTDKRTESVRPNRSGSSTNSGSSEAKPPVRQSNQPVQVAPPVKEIQNNPEPFRQIKPREQEGRTQQPQNVKPPQQRSEPVSRPQRGSVNDVRSNQRTQQTVAPRQQPQRSSQPVIRNAQPSVSRPPVQSQPRQRVQPPAQQKSSTTSPARERSSSGSRGPVRNL